MFWIENKKSKKRTVSYWLAWRRLVHISLCHQREQTLIKSLTRITLVGVFTELCTSPWMLHVHTCCLSVFSFSMRLCRASYSFLPALMSSSRMEIRFLVSQLVFSRLWTFFLHWPRDWFRSSRSSVHDTSSDLSWVVWRKREIESSYGPLIDQGRLPQGMCGRDHSRVSAFQPVLLGILETIPHNATAIQFVRLYSTKAKDIWIYCYCSPVGSRKKINISFSL